MEIRRIESEQMEEALTHVLEVFMQFEAPDYSDEGVETFKRTGIEDREYIDSLTMYGAFHNQELVGVIATRNEGRHIALFFVKALFHGKGIGRALWEKVLTESTAKKITVNSSPFAKEVYHRFGFIDTEEEKEYEGVRFIPMIYSRIPFIYSMYGFG